MSSALDPSTCGKGDVTGYSGFAVSEGQMMLPECTSCRAKSLKPLLVGTVNVFFVSREALTPESRQ